MSLRVVVVMYSALDKLDLFRPSEVVSVERLV